MVEPSTRVANRAAAAALITGLLSVPGALTFALGVVLGLVAVVLGFVGVTRAEQLGGAGQGLAVAGIVTGMLGLVLAAALVFLLSP